MTGTTGDSRILIRKTLAFLQDLFKASTRKARERFWEKLTSERGRADVRRLINNPSMTLNHFDSFLTFREYIEKRGEI